MFRMENNINDMSICYLDSSVLELGRKFNINYISINKQNPLITSYTIQLLINDMPEIIEIPTMDITP